MCGHIKLGCLTVWTDVSACRQGCCIVNGEDLQAFHRCQCVKAQGLACQPPGLLRLPHNIVRHSSGSRAIDKVVPCMPAPAQPCRVCRSRRWGRASRGAARPIGAWPHTAAAAAAAAAPGSPAPPPRSPPCLAPHTVQHYSESPTSEVLYLPGIALAPQARLKLSRITTSCKLRPVAAACTLPLGFSRVEIKPKLHGLLCMFYGHGGPSAPPCAWDSAAAMSPMLTSARAAAAPVPPCSGAAPGRVHDSELLPKSPPMGYTRLWHAYGCLGPALIVWCSRYYCLSLVGL